MVLLANFQIRNLKMYVGLSITEKDWSFVFIWMGYAFEMFYKWRLDGDKSIFAEKQSLNMTLNKPCNIWI